MSVVDGSADDGCAGAAAAGSASGTSARRLIATSLWLLLAALSTVLFTWPVLLVIAAGADYLPGFHESLAYRYFLNIRILDGQGGAVWLPQGQILSAMQNAIVAGLHHGAGIALNDLRPMLWWYGVLTNLAISALYAAVMIATCLARQLTWTDRALILVIGPFTVLVTRFAGFYYRIQPDYVALDMVFVAAAVFLTLAQLRNPQPYRLRDALLAGAFVGLAVANKVVLLAPTGLVVLMVATQRPTSLRLMVVRCAVAGGAAALTFSLSFLACYLGSVADAWRAFVHWLMFLSLAGAEHGGFWAEKFNLYVLSNNYHAILLIWLAASLALTATIAWRGAWRSRAGVLLAGNLAAGLLLALALLKRGAGSTLFEVASMLVGLAALSAAVAFGRHPRPLVPLLVLAGLTGFTATQVQYRTDWSIVTRWREVSGGIWDIHAFLAGQKRRVIVVMPDKSYAWNSAEELIDIGLGISEKWGFIGHLQTPLRDIDTAAAVPPIELARRMKARFAPDFEFRTRPGALPPGALVLWAEKWDTAAGRPLRDLDPHEAARWHPLTALMAQPDSRCRSWEAGFGRDMRVHACVVS